MSLCNPAGCPTMTTNDWLLLNLNGLCRTNSYDWITNYPVEVVAPPLPYIAPCNKVCLPLIQIAVSKGKTG